MYTYTVSLALSLKLTFYFCDIFLNTAWLYIIVNDLIKKPTGQWLNKVRLGGKAKLRILGKRRAESGVASKRREKQDGNAILRKGAKPCG